VSESMSCLQPIDTVRASVLCGSDTILDIGNYLIGYQIMKGDNTVFAIDSSICIDPISGNSTPCINLPPIWNAQTNVCQRVLRSLELQFGYTIVEGLVRLVNVTVVPDFTSITLSQPASGSTTVYVKQSFGTNWVRVCTEL
jgi:hypothetical protein